MRESLLKAEAKYLKDEDGESSRDRESSRDGESSKGGDSSRDRNKDKDSDSDSSKDSDSDSSKGSDSSDEDVYSRKPKTNSSKIRCDERNVELTQKNFGRHIQPLEHKKNERLYNRNKTIESASESGKKVANGDIEQKIDKQYSELEGIKYCDSRDMYLDNNTAYNKHVETLIHKNSVKLNNGEIIKNGGKFDCVTCTTTLSQ